MELTVGRCRVSPTVCYKINCLSRCSQTKTTTKAVIVVALAFGLKLGVTRDFAGDFFDLAFRLLCRARNTILVHVVFLSFNETTSTVCLESLWQCENGEKFRYT